MTPPAHPAQPPVWLRHPAHLWQSGTLDVPALLAAADALAGRSGFDALAQCFARNWLATQAAHPALRAVFRNTPRYLLLVACLVLHHQRDPADPTSGATPGRLDDFFAHTMRGVLAVSASQVAAILGHARAQRMIEDLRSADLRDARFRPLRPTPLLQHILQRWVLGFLDAVDGDADFVLPAPPAAMAARAGLLGEVFSYRLAAIAHDRFILFQGLQQELAWLLRHDHGYRLFLQLVALMQVQPDGSALVRASTSALAERTAIGRGTVRNLLADALAQGWFAPGSSAGALRLAPQSLRVTRHWIARELVWIHGLACTAHARLDGAAAPCRPAGSPLAGLCE